MPHYLGLAHYGLAGIAFQWLILTLTCFRLQRIVTADTWPLSDWFRNRIRERADSAKKGSFAARAWSETYELITCPWCFGWWTCVVVFTLASQCVPIPLPVVQAISASAIVGYAGMKED